MEVTRRKCLRYLGIAVSAIGGGLCWIGRTALPRPVVRANRVTDYPGTVVSMGDIHMRSRWSG